MISVIISTVLLGLVMGYIVLLLFPSILTFVLKFIKFIFKTVIWVLSFPFFAVLSIILSIKIIFNNK